MINFQYEIINTPIERCMTIKERIPSVKTYYNNIIKNYSNLYYNPYGYDSFLEKILSVYKKLYKEQLTDEEKTILIIYYMIEDDNKLKNDIIKTNCNLNLIARKYYLNKELVKLRWNIMKEINKYKRENEKKLTLKNDEN